MVDFIMQNIVTIIFSSITIFVAILIFILQKERKQLSYDVISSTPLIVKNDEIRDIKIFYKDQELNEDVSLVLLKIVNNGNKEIEAKDFSEDIGITTSSEILSVEVKETNPPHLMGSVYIDNELFEFFNEPKIHPLLLNKKDEIILKLIIKSFNDDITVNSRITGVKDITKLKKKEDNFFNRIIKSPTISIGVVLLSFMVITGKYISEGQATLNYIAKMVSVTGLAIGLGFGTAAVVLKLESKIKNSR